MARRNPFRDKGWRRGQRQRGLGDVIARIGDDALATIYGWLKSISKYLNDPKTRNSINDFIDAMQQTYDFIVH
ncbi:MAG: hypothetical protein ACO22Z_11400, partial [Paracoccaceae bacterium]